jgi:hypothetical protein
MLKNGRPKRFPKSVLYERRGKLSTDLYSDQDNMAFLSGFVKSGLSLLGKDASAFPYTIGQKVEWYENQSIWSLHRGVKKVRSRFE